MWKTRFQRFRTATKLNKEDEVDQVDSLLYALGPEAENIFKTLTFTAAGDEKKWSKVIEKLDSHFIPQRNIIYEQVEADRRLTYVL